MKTLVTKFNDNRIFDYIKDNQVIAFPTETVYGLGVIFNSEYAFQNLVDVKHRRPDKPFTLMLGNKNDISKYAIFSDKTKKIIDNFFPGELTILVQPQKDLFPWDIILKFHFRNFHCHALCEPVKRFCFLLRR